jgi:protein SCO1/2
MNELLSQFIIAALCAFALIASALGAEPEDVADMHAHHHMMQMMMQTKSSTVDYKVPDIQLVRADGKQVSLAEELNDGRPVVMNFIYTTCTTVCPLTSKTFADLQDKLGSEREKVHMVSISIDPEQDTPQVLAEYARKYGAGKQWQFYTGTVEASIAAQRAFDVYRGGKMKHNPVTFIRTAPGKPWLRIEGFAKSDELLHGLGNTVTSSSTQPADIAY